MSLIAYRDGLLMSDRMGMSRDSSGDAEFVSQMKKMHIHSSGCFAFAYVGGDLTKRVLAKVMDQMYVILSTFYREGEEEECLILDANNNKFLPKPLSVSLKDATFIVMTSDRVFFHEGGGDFMVEYDADQSCCGGIVNNCFRVACAFDLPAQEAFVRAVSFVHPVQPFVDVYAMSSLKPFPTPMGAVENEPETDHG